MHIKPYAVKYGSGRLGISLEPRLTFGGGEGYTFPSSVEGVGDALALNPGSLSGGGKREPGTHCLHMRQNSQKSREFVFFSVYQSVNVNLDPRSLPKNRLCWLRFRLRTLIATNLPVTSKQH